MLLSMLQVEPGVRFMGIGEASFFVNDSQLVTKVSLSFRTSQLAAILVHMASPCEEGPSSLVMQDRIGPCCRLSIDHVLCVLDVLCRLTS